MKITQDKIFTHVICPLLVMAVYGSAKAYIDVERIKTERENDIERIVRIEKSVNSIRNESKKDNERLQDKLDDIKHLIMERK